MDKPTTKTKNAQNSVINTVPVSLCVSVGRYGEN